MIADSRIIAFSCSKIIGQESEVELVAWKKHTLWIGRDEGGNMRRIQCIEYGDSACQTSQANIRKRELLLGILNGFKHGTTVHEVGAIRSTYDYIKAFVTTE